MASLFGFKDWQRFSGWDSPLLINETGVLYAPGNHSYGPFDVRQFERIAGVWSVDQVCTLTFTWWADPPASLFLGQRILVTDRSNMHETVFSFANLGPFVTIDVVGPPPITNTAYVFATNRPNELSLTPPSPLLIARNAITIGAGVTRSEYPTGFYSGQADLWLFVSQASNLYLYAQSAAGTWLQIREWAALGAGSDTRDRIVVPGTRWRLDVNNASGVASSYYLAVVADYKG